LKLSDTSKEARRVQVEIFRRMTPEERLQKALEQSEISRELLAQGVRHRHPHYTEQEVRMAVIRLQLPESLFRSVYPGMAGLEP